MNSAESQPRCTSLDIRLGYILSGLSLCPSVTFSVGAMGAIRSVDFQAWGAYTAACRLNHIISTGVVNETNRDPGDSGLCLVPLVYKSANFCWQAEDFQISHLGTHDLQDQ